MTKDEALRLALEALQQIAHVSAMDYEYQQWAVEAITAIKEALAESEPNYKKALEVWLDKTEWVQETVKPHELGMHRADVLKQRIQEALAQPKQDGKCKHCTDGCPACDARKLPEREIATAVLEHCYSPMAVTSDMIDRTTEVIKAKLKEWNA
jgi:hypothetical protein